MKKLLYLLFISVILIITGCSDFLKDSSQDLVIVKTPSDVNEVLLGSGYLKKKEIRYLMSGDIAPFLNYMDDDVDCVAGLKENANDFTLMGRTYGYTTWQYEVERSYDKNSLLPDDKTWNNLYSYINLMNVLLHELEDINITTDNDVLLTERMRGEIKFLRAQYYFILVNLYADAYSPSSAEVTLGVPLKLTYYVEYDKNKESQFERTSVAKVYNQIVKDLKESVEHLDNSPQIKKHRVNKQAAQILLSRVYLYMQDWENAKNTANESLSESNTLTHFSTLGDNVFLNEDCEEIVFSNGSLHCQNNIYGVPGDYGVSYDLIQKYDTINDYRYKVFFTKRDTFALGNKYKRHLHISYISDLYTIRTAEAYLNLAEAEVMLGNDNLGHKVLNDLLNTRIQDYTPSENIGAALIQEIRQERRKELCFEGHRWFDLRRYAVCEKYPFSKDIVRHYSVYEDGKRNFIIGEVYLLPAGDPAYTMQIPKSVLDFDSNFPCNDRKERKYESTFDLN